MIRVVYPGSWFFTHPGSQIQGSKRHRIRIRNTDSEGVSLDDPHVLKACGSRSEAGVSKLCPNREVGIYAFSGRLETYSLEVFGPKKQLSGSDGIFMDPYPRIRNPELWILNYESGSGPDLQTFFPIKTTKICQIDGVSLKLIKYWTSSEISLNFW
jgi:hypothetical protein